MESIYFLGGEVWLRNRMISVCCLHGGVPTVMCSKRRLSGGAVWVKAAEPARRGSAPLFCKSCRAVQVSWFKGCSLRQEIVSCSEVYCNKVHSPGGMCCWAHESLYGLAVLTSALWFIHAIPQQEWQKCERRMVFPASPFPTRWAFNWEAAINPEGQLCSGLPVPLVLPTLPCVCWGILLLAQVFAS